jgi:2-dehydropantoate 2-reductase
VRTVDPNARVMNAIDPRRIIGCVVYPAARLAAPGVIEHIEGNRYPLGELDGSTTPRITAISDALVAAGFKSPILDNVRSEIWLKLWGNLSFNPISALSHSTLVDLCQFPLTRALAQNMMAEAQAIANALGITFRVSIEKCIAGAEKVGKHKTSMLQDIEAGREPEIDALVGAVIELGRITGMPTPHIDTVYALVKLLAQTIAADQLCVRATATAALNRAGRVGAPEASPAAA